MSLFTIFLIAFFAFIAIMNFVDVGAFTHGKVEIRQGNRIAIMAFIGALIDLVILAGLLLGW